MTSTDEAHLLAAAGGDPAKRIWLLLIDNGYVFHRPRADAFEVVPAAAYLAKCREMEAAVKALRVIADWHLPPSGRFWHDSDGNLTTTPMSYEAAFGSNGARDFMRAKAIAALRAAEPGEVGR